MRSTCHACRAGSSATTISNLQGTNPVASMVVFQDGKPAKKEYRRFTIKTVIGADDFATMKEIIGRRFRRAAEADEENRR